MVTGFESLKAHQISLYEVFFLPTTGYEHAHKFLLGSFHSPHIFQMLRHLKPPARDEVTGFKLRKAYQIYLAWGVFWLTNQSWELP